jgi:hypothetical protein
MPIISGTIVDQRDHVFITLFCPERLRATALLSNFWSTAGPFFADLVISIYSPGV